MNILSWSQGGVRARFAVFMLVLGLVVGVRAIAPGHARALQIDCSQDISLCDGTGGDDGSGGDQGSGGDTGDTGGGWGDTGDAGSGGDPGNGWGDPSDTGDTGSNDGAGVIDCDGAFDCTDTATSTSGSDPSDPGDAVPVGDPDYDRNTTFQQPETEDHPPEFRGVPNGMPVYQPFQPNPCGPYLREIDQVYADAEAGWIDQVAAQAQVKALGEQYDLCTKGTLIARADSPGPLAAASARQATQAHTQIRMANLAARSATKAAMKAAGRHSAHRLAQPKRHAKARRG